MPFIGRAPAVKSRTMRSGPVLSFPMCSDWSCDDDEDWDAIGPDDEDYAAVRREHDIVHYHEPRAEWRQRLQEERDLSGGDPLWWGKKNDESRPQPEVG